MRFVGVVSSVPNVSRLEIQITAQAIDIASIELGLVLLRTDAHGALITDLGTVQTTLGLVDGKVDAIREPYAALQPTCRAMAKPTVFWRRCLHH